MQTASVITYGCTHNQKDSQLIEAQLLKGGYKLVSEDQAEIVVVNTCTVKSPTENKIMRKLQDLQGKKKVVVTGCLSQANPDLIKSRFPNYIVMGVNAAKFILPALRSDNLLPLTQEIPFNKPLLESTQWNPYLNIVQINEGCLNSCTFCATKQARGRLHSFPRASIIEAIRSNPTPEVWLTSQDTGCWGFDINDNLANLLNDIDKIRRKFYLRVGMGNPNNFIKILDEIVEAYHSPKVYKFLHLPVQAGSNAVLRHMRRGYTVEEYETIVEAFRKEFPQLTLSTDVICGYPTETEEDFIETLRTIEKTRPNITNISRFWERKGTPAADLPQLPHEIRKERARRVAELTTSIQLADNEKWVGWSGEVLITEKGSKGGMVGRNLHYKPIVINAPDTLLGTFQTVRITKAETTFFYGELLH
ncbi:MAG: tRNA (N(6)-L-threonylcarbamoyladenosine(37)-C(2))-methylthiotransferase [Methanobacteriota archaeon]|nr:MAG: tRNA (N(6)-L-threonylcarbamoyladenosine(37)-C(2))-methylthiotransferase [Euryarchaeota archaeon]